MPNWEYCKITQQATSGTPSSAPVKLRFLGGKGRGEGPQETEDEDLDDALARLGREGWELASYAPYFVTEGVRTTLCLDGYILKRPVQEP